MRNRIVLAGLALAGVLVAAEARAHRSACRLEVVVDGVVRAEYSGGGTTYIEALRGRDYSLRLSNPTPDRVAVALSVDGLNTINARHSDAWGAAKWVIEPYDTIEIAGWQVDDSAARRFVFTGERKSYGAAIGQTENLGVIEAVFFRERPRQVMEFQQRDEEKRQASPAPSASAQGKLSDDYAATGMGGRTRHDVTSVDIDLEPRPIASTRIRYEFRAQLVKLGILGADPSPLQRRQKARGFERYCPEPD